MGLLELLSELIFILILLLTNINLVFVGFHIISEVLVCLLSLRIVNKLVVKILEVWQVSNDPALVLFHSLLLELILLQLEHLKLVS